MSRLLGTGLLLLTLATCGSPTPASRPGETVDWMVVGGTVVTMNDGYDVFSPGFVAVTGSRIRAVGPLSEAKKFSARRRLDAGGKLILPGLINGHQHAAMTLLRGLADDMKLMEWLKDYIFPAESRNVDKDFVYWGTRLGVAEMIRSGTTTYADMYYFEDEVARATAQLGMRGILGETIIGFPSPDSATPEQALKYAESYIRRWRDHPLIRPAVAPHAPFTCSRKVLLACRALADRYQVPVLIHVAETREEVETIRRQTGFRPVEYLQRIGFLSDRVVAKHVVWATDREIAMLKEAGVGVIHNPDSNMKLGSGIARIPEMLAAGVDVGLGTDGAASNNNLDLFQAMDMMAKLQKVARSDPTVITARQALEAATIGGARALDLDRMLGSLEEGKAADLAVVGLDSPAAMPFFDPYSSVVYALVGSAVETVIINGKLVMEQRRIQGLDEAELRRQVIRYQKQIQQSLKVP